MECNFETLYLLSPGGKYKVSRPKKRAAGKSHGQSIRRRDAANRLRCGMAYRDSVIVKIWSAFTSFSTCRMPLGQRISMVFAKVNSPRPK